MREEECTLFLQWALPRLDLAWPGFRKVRSQVCNRLRRRMRDLGVDSFAAYREKLEADPAEWQGLDGFCRITISRFCRNGDTFRLLARIVLPRIAEQARTEGRAARIWSAGCASGEEPYTLRILWELEVKPRFPDVELCIVATDVDATVLERARQARYPSGSLRELKPDMIAQAFHDEDGHYRLKAAYRKGLLFLRQDLREETPRGRFDLVLCRNLAFTYFATPLQETALARIEACLAPGGILVIGSHEHLPPSATGWTPLRGNRSILERTLPTAVSPSEPLQPQFERSAR